MNLIISGEVSSSNFTSFKGLTGFHLRAFLPSVWKSARPPRTSHSMIRKYLERYKVVCTMSFSTRVGLCKGVKIKSKKRIPRVMPTIGRVTNHFAVYSTRGIHRVRLEFNLTETLKTRRFSDTDSEINFYCLE